MFIEIRGLWVINVQVFACDASHVGTGHLGFSHEPTDNVAAYALGGDVRFALKCSDGQAGGNDALVQLERVKGF